MSIEELLKPRYKVIADYPRSEFVVGDVLELKLKKEVHFLPFYTDKSGYFWYERSLEKYPHLFKKLKWHEERKESEMPEYVVLNDQWRKDFNTPAKVLKVEAGDNGIFLTVDKVNDLITRLHVENLETLKVKI